jgi:hypothetical protein
MVVAFIALCVALAGTATALPGRSRVKTDDIARNAVRTKHIKSGNVKRSDIGANAIDSARVGSDALTGRDILESSLEKVPTASNADSAPIAKLVYKSAQYVADSPPSLTSTQGSVSCDSGFKATGGGVRVSNPNSSGNMLRLQSSFPNGSDGWTADVLNEGTTPGVFTVWVVCAPAAATG